MVFFLPFGIDAVVIYLSARNGMFFWLYPILATAGSVTGAAITYWIGRKGGEMGLERLLPGRAPRAISRTAYRKAAQPRWRCRRSCHRRFRSRPSS
jgi:membrane protein YqaA with SNARE-associated domain